MTGVAQPDWECSCSSRWSGSLRAAILVGAFGIGHQPGRESRAEWDALPIPQDPKRRSDDVSRSRNLVGRHIDRDLRGTVGLRANEYEPSRPRFLDRLLHSSRLRWLGADGD